MKFNQIKPWLGVPINWGNPITKGLVAWWLMNENSGNKVGDLSGNRNTGTFPATGVTWTKSPYGSAVNIVGGAASTAKITTTTIIPAFPYTITLLVRPSTTLTNNSLCSLNTVSTYKPALLCNVGGKILFWPAESAYRYFAAAGNAILINGKYHLVTLLYTGDVTTTQLYIDEKLVAPDTTLGTTEQDAHNGFTWGAGAYNTDVAIAWGGVCNRLLSASEIAQLYREPFAMFDRRQIWSSGEAGATVSLSGVTTATSSAVGTITSSETLVATVSATGGASSSAGCAMTLIGVATAQSTGSAALSSGESTTGLVAALSTASGTVVLSGSLAGSVTCVSAASGSLRCLYSLAGVIAVASGASGAVTTSTDTASLAGVVACIAAADGAVKQAAELAGIVSAVCTPVALLSTSVGGAWYKIVAAGSAGIATSQLANQATRILVSAYTAEAQGIKKTSSGLTTIQTCAILSVGGKINIFLTADFAYGTSYSVTFKVYRGASQLYQCIRAVNSSNGITIMKHFSDTPGAGTHTYTLQANASTPSDNQMLATACSLVLDEWKGK